MKGSRFLLVGLGLLIAPTIYLPNVFGQGSQLHNLADHLNQYADLFNFVISDELADGLEFSLSENGDLMIDYNYPLDENQEIYFSLYAYDQDLSDPDSKIEIEWFDRIMDSQGQVDLPVPPDGRYELIFGLVDNEYSCKKVNPRWGHIESIKPSPGYFCSFLADDDMIDNTRSFFGNGLDEPNLPEKIDPIIESEVMVWFDFIKVKTAYALEYNQVAIFSIDLSVTDGVISSSFLEPEIPACCSSVAFLPGMQSSELYGQGFFNNDRLWVPHNNGDVVELYLDENSKSLNDVKVGQSIERAGIPGVKELRVYVDLFNEFNDLVQAGQINEWRDLSYDWRYTPFQVVDRQINGLDRDYYLIDEIKSLVKQSKTGQVTLVTHSNGGLVAKALMMRLEEQGLENLIDKIIFTVPPHLGTPKALASLLHGTDQAIPGILNEMVAREFARNLPNAYNLLPTKEFWNTSDQLHILFDPALTTGANFYDQYGNSIDSWQEYQDFLFGIEGRINPSATDLYTPIIINRDLWDQVSAEHELLDNWTIPDQVQVYTVAGEGLSTIAGWQYRNKHVRHNVFDTRTVMYPHPIWTNAGDETVVVDSVPGWGEVIYFDQDRYNKTYKDEKVASHAELFRSQEVRQYIESLILHRDHQPQLFNNTSQHKHEPTFNKKEVSSQSPVTLLATDTDGNRTGVFQGEIVIEIPGSDYVRFAGADYLLLPDQAEVTITYEYDDTDTESDKSVQFSYRSISNSNQLIEDIVMTEPAVIDPNTSGQLLIQGDQLIVENNAGAFLISAPESNSGGGGRSMNTMESRKSDSDFDNNHSSESKINSTYPGQVAGASVSIDHTLQLLITIFRSDLSNDVKIQLIKMLYDY